MENGIIEVFARCVTCGVQGAKTRKVAKYARESGIAFNAQKTGDFRTPSSNLLHLEYLRSIGLPEDYKIGIVVENGNKVTELLKWKP